MSIPPTYHRLPIRAPPRQPPSKRKERGCMVQRNRSVIDAAACIFLQPVLSRHTHLRHRPGAPPLFVSNRRIMDGAVKESLEQFQQFKVAKDLRRAVHSRLPVNELPEVLLGQNDGPHKFAQGHSLRRPASANLPVAALKFNLSLAQQPFPKM